MEEDRIATNLGPGVEEEMEGEAKVVEKQPKRRFVGRKTVEKAEGQAAPNANIEDSGAIQGERTMSVL
jgi:2-(3-amino-3-carboxypropyl)histidine synthase